MGRLFGLILGLLLGSGGIEARAASLPAAPVAGSRNLFTVATEVQQPGTVHAKTRAEALAQGQRQAFVALVQRLSTTAAPVVTDQELSGLIMDRRVLEEKVTAGYYKVMLEFQFDPEKSRAFLQQKNITHSEVTSKPIVILPLYVVHEETLTFEGENSWRQEWQKILAERSGTLLRLVLANDEPGLPTVDELLNQNMEKITQYVRVKGADALLVSQMTLTAPVANQYHLKLNQVLVDPYGQVHRFNPVVYESQQDTLGDLLDKAAREVTTQLDRVWKERTGGGNTEAGEMKVTALFQRLEEWNTMANRLKEVTLLQQYEVLALRPYQLDLKLQYVGSFPQFMQALAGAGLVLQSTPTDGDPSGQQQAYRLTLLQPHPLS